MGGGRQSVLTTSSGLGMSRRGIQLPALVMETSVDGTGPLGIDQMESSILEPNADDVLGIVFVLPLVEERALDRTASSS